MDWPENPEFRAMKWCSLKENTTIIFGPIHNFMTYYVMTNKIDEKLLALILILSFIYIYHGVR